MKQIRASMLCWVFLFSAVIASPPVPVITTTVDENSEIVPGDIVVFDASGTLEATGFKWAVIPAKFADNRPTHEVSSDGKSIRLASRPGYYMVLLATTNKESEISIVKRDVTVGKPLPGPGPNPGPINPDPPKPVVPKFPDEAFGMSTAAFNAANALQDKSRLKDLSMAFRIVGGASVAGGYNSLKEIELASTEANRKAIYGKIEPTSPEGITLRNSHTPFFAALQPRIKELSQGDAATPQKYGAMLVEIAIGVESASKK